ncbi:MAG: DUF1566 domain-containing protein [Candidatus Kapaibacteriota bacterium]
MKILATLFVAVVACLFATPSPASLPPYLKTMKGLTGSGPLTHYVITETTVIDTVTTLMWQRVGGGEMTWQNAKTYCDTLTAGGFTDWRLPSSHELFSLSDFSRGAPAIGSAFGTTDAEYWWSADTLMGDATRIWCTNAGGGIGPHPMSETISAGGAKRFHVRAVRDQASPLTLPAHFVDEGNATVSDKATDRQWMQFCLTGAYTYAEALTAADTLTHGGLTDWRLPTIKELQSLNIVAFRDPSFDLQFFPCIGSTRMLWSSTALVSRNNDQAWILHPEFGIVSYALRTAKHYVLCVRGGQQDVTSVDEPGAPSHLPFPNPTSDLIFFKAEQQHVMVYDITGATLISVDNARSVSLSPLPPSTYIVRTIDVTGNHRTTLVVKY